MKTLGLSAAAQYAVLATVGLALYLWPALSAPAVLWSDSRVDLDWARRGIGIWNPIPSPATADASVHPGKPGYLLFLRVARVALPRLGETRSILVIQSLLLWLSMTTTSAYVARRRGMGPGLTLYVAFILCLRLRDTASAVMSEALSAAAALPLAALLLMPPWSRASGFAFWGAATGLLFWIRPNVGAVTMGLALVLLAKRWLALAFASLAFAGILIPVWILTSPGAGRDASRGIVHPVLGGSVDYYWASPATETPGRTESETVKAKLRQAAQNWRRALADRSADGRRQLLWRAFHGLLATEFYDARWSPFYLRLDAIARTLTPFVTLASISLLLTFPFRGPDRVWNLAAPLVLLALVTQNLVLGSHPRFVLPLLPILFLLAAAGLPKLDLPLHWLTAAILFSMLTALVAECPALVDWEWGRIEAQGVKILQRIPKGALPKREPATLHIRIAAPRLPSGAHLLVLGPGGRQLYSSLGEPHRNLPAVKVSLPEPLLAQNRREDVAIELISFGDYDAYHYLLFPVIPRPWSAAARRVGSAELSPSTGISSGSLDWWAHAGSP